MKVTKDLLEKLRGITSDLNTLKLEVAELELAKTSKMSNIFILNQEYQEISKDMTDKYWKDVQVDLNDGSIKGASNTLKKS